MKTGHRFTIRSLPLAAIPLLSIVAFAALVANCASTNVTRPSSASPEGVGVTIRDFECLPDKAASNPNEGADLVVNLEIRNPLAAPIVVQKGAMQVVDTEGGSMRRRGTSQRGPVEIAAGTSRRMEMHFLGSSKHCCSSRLALNASGVTVGDRAITLEPITFAPFCLF